MTLIPWKAGKCLVWDFTCVDTLAPSHIADSNIKSGVIAEKTEAKKLAKYSNLSDSNHVVVPICVETLGSWGKEGMRLINEIDALIKRETGEIRSTKFLFQALNMAVQRGNAISVLSTIPRTSTLDEIFLL